MNKRGGMSQATSRLAQSGITSEPFHLDSLSISEIESFTALRIRALPGLDRSNLVDMNMPRETGECQGQNPVTLCLRPNEWLMLQLPASQDTPDAAASPVDPGFYRWNDSDGLAVLRVTGEAAAWLMHKNSGLDFNVDRQTASHCAQCKFGKIRVLVLYRRAENKPGDFYLVVDRSLVNYLWTLLVATAPHAVGLYRAIKDRGLS